MTIQDNLKRLIKFLKISSLWGGTGIFIAYHIRQTYRSIDKIVNPKVLDREKQQAEYIYMDDPLYNLTLKLEQDKELKQAVGFGRIWKSLKYSLAWKLMWLCRHGNRDQRNIALEQLATFKNIKVWDYCKLAQALDKNTAVLLARTRGADLRYFLPPPIHVRRATLSAKLLSYKLRDLIVSVQPINPHYCIEHFICKYFTNVQEQAVEVDIIPSKPDSISERDLCILCLDALYHHLSTFHHPNYEQDLSIVKLVNKGLLSVLAEAMLRNPHDSEFDLAVLKVLTILSVYTNLLTDFFQNGLVRDLSRLLRSPDIRLSSSAAVCLANLSGEEHYRPGLYLLHPIYRTDKAPSCDTLLVHGLRGGVFVTWRQRDKKCAEPLGILEVTMSDEDLGSACEDECQKTLQQKPKYHDPDLQQVMEDMIEIEDEVTLADLDVILHDIPILAKREPTSTESYCAKQKRTALHEEDQDKCSYTQCWPKDWLPRDCANLRVLGINYWTSLSDWLERCPLQSADIATRACDIVPALIDAGVGKKDIPVVWLAHSMGGLIVKQALVEASQSSEKSFKKISENTKAVLFFSTPHKGSSVATMPRAAAAILWPSTDVRQLQENSPVLLALHKAFIEFSNLYNWETISFAESLPTYITAFKVPVQLVQPNSADLGRGVFYVLPLDHLSICKPATRQSVLYTTVLDILRRASTNEDEVEQPYVAQLFNRLYRLAKNKVQEIIDIFDETQKIDEL